MAFNIHQIPTQFQQPPPPQPQSQMFNAPFRPTAYNQINQYPGFGYVWGGQRIPEIKNWSFSYGLENKRNLKTLACYISGTIIGGQTHGHTDGSKIVTSKLKRLDFDKSIAETTNGNLYRLGNMDKSSEKFYNDGLQFLMNKGILKG